MYAICVQRGCEAVCARLANASVVDMCAGIGPFAIPAAKRGCRVYANDLNPASYEYLEVNTRLNKVDSLIECFNMDAREFVRKMVSDDKLVFDADSRSHFIINLPASAVTFLDVFADLFDDTDRVQAMPFVHCYGFTSDVSRAAEAMHELAEQHLGGAIERYTVHRVRDVAPCKWMMCISFELPRTLACIGRGDAEEPTSKKQRVE